jgi:hypothetical protein
MPLNLRGKSTFNPAVVTDGLILYIDPANNASVSLSSLEIKSLVKKYSTYTDISAGRFFITDNKSVGNVLYYKNNIKTIFAPMDTLSGNIGPASLLGGLTDFTFQFFTKNFFNFDFQNGPIGFNDLPRITFFAAGPRLSGGKINFVMQKGNTSSMLPVTSNNFNIEEDKWYFITIAKSNNSVTLYLNSYFEEFILNTNYIIPLLSLFFGSSNTYFGQILLYDRCLNFNEVKNNYENFKSRYGIDKPLIDTSELT